MLMNYNRTTQHDGAYFEEPDFFLNNVLFYNSTKVTVKLSYCNQGIGVLIAKDGFINASNLEDAYGIFFVEDVIEVVKYSEGERKVISRVAYRITMPVEDFVFDVYKDGDYIYVARNGRNLVYQKIEKSYSSYSFGFYVNRWNTLKDISYRSNVPQEWDLNVISSHGGKVQFYKDGFSIVDAKTDIQIEQSNIPLKKGMYYLSYDAIDEEGQFDIEAYIYLSNNKEGLTVEEKNILDANRFVLEEDTDVSIHFRGNHGSIEQIAIKTNASLPYVSTSGSSGASDGSHIEIDLSKVLAFEINGKINSLPENARLSDKNRYYLASIEGEEVTAISSLAVAPSLFTISLEEHILTVKTVADNTIEIPAEGILSLLYNMDVIITDFVVTYKNGKTLDYLNQHTQLFYVPATIKSPIIAVNDYSEPLDKSSAYRRVMDGDSITYRFTNYEREFFETTERTMLLEKPIRKDNPDVTVYGLKPAAQISLHKLYDAEKDYSDIRLATTQFDILSPEQYVVDTNGSITIKKAFEGIYDRYVIDYLKEASYAVNFDEELNVYEVDISHSENTKVMYDYGEDGSIKQYISTGIKPDSDKYIVLSI